MTQSDTAPRKPSFGQIQRWAKERGFFLEYHPHLDNGRRTWLLTWTGPDSKSHQAHLTDLARVEVIVQEALASSKACQPGQWFLSWMIYDFGNVPAFAPWCPWRCWIGPAILEGRQWLNEYSRWPKGNDPTPYESLEVALTASTLLGLEYGGRLHLTVNVLPLSKEMHVMPTPGCTPEALHELILLCASRQGKGNVLMADNPKLIAQYVNSISKARLEDIEAAVASLIADGRLIRDIDRGRSGQARIPILRVWAPESE